MEPNEIIALASNILERSKTTSKILSATALSGGANNRVFKIESEAASYLLKIYYHADNDLKNRAVTDFNFCSFAWNHGIHFAPKPLGISAQNHAALYEFIAGRRLTFSEITPAIIDQAIAFFVQLNQHRSILEATRLPAAAEACFSLQEHFSCIQRRINKLQTIEGNQYLGTKVLTLIDDHILPRWKMLIEKTDLTASLLLNLSERCLSPSDFGFHNALLQDDDKLRFFDFEYAGWDDPAKMICDFFCQPEVAVPSNYFSYFANQIAKNFPNPKAIAERASILLPFYQLKWCCILLNEFLPHEASRRQFSLDNESLRTRKQQQIEKTSKVLNQF